MIYKFDRSELYVNFNPTTSLYTLSQSMLMKFHLIKVYEETLQGHTRLTHLIGSSGLRAVNVHLIPIPSGVQCLSTGKPFTNRKSHASSCQPWCMNTASITAPKVWRGATLVLYRHCARNSMTLSVIVQEIDKSYKHMTCTTNHALMLPYFCCWSCSASSFAW
jgi:hypothetical protein